MYILDSIHIVNICTIYTIYSIENVHTHIVYYIKHAFLQENAQASVLYKHRMTIHLKADPPPMQCLCIQTPPDGCCGEAQGVPLETVRYS